MTSVNTASVDPKTFTRFADFYPFYLSEHSNRTCRRLHFAGSTLGLICLARPAMVHRLGAVSGLCLRLDGSLWL